VSQLSDHYPNKFEEHTVQHFVVNSQNILGTKNDWRMEGMHDEEYQRITYIFHKMLLESLKK
jgi:hypothetical protein